MSERVAGTASDLPVIGLPADAPARPTEAIVYPAVHDMPAPRSANLLTNMELKQFEDDLLAAREDQKKQSAPPRPPERKKPEVATKPAQPAKPASAATRPRAPSSTSAIY